MEPTDTFDAEPTKPAIYSPRVVLVFSALFSGLAGGILTYYSLAAAGRPVGAQRALKVSIMFIGVVIGLSLVLPLGSNGKGLSLVLGYGWGYVLNEFYLKKYLADEASHPRKSWVKPLLICLAVAIGITGALGALAIH